MQRGDNGCCRTFASPFLTAGTIAVSRYTYMGGSVSRFRGVGWGTPPRKQRKIVSRVASSTNGSQMRRSCEQGGILFVAP